MVYVSGSQPGVRVPPWVREKSLRVRQIFIKLRFTLKLYHKKPFRYLLRGTRVFFFLLSGTLAKKRLRTAPLVYVIKQKNISSVPENIFSAKKLISFGVSCIGQVITLARTIT